MGDRSALENPSANEGANSVNLWDAMFESVVPQPFDDFLADTDTDTDNSNLPFTHRWVWYCKFLGCPDYYSAWSCKTNFLLHLYETPVHREDSTTKTRKGRRQLARAWREATTFALSWPKERPTEADFDLAAFEYSRLDGPRTIRLVELDQEVDSFESPITCSISQICLDDKEHPYKAISYCWGNPAETETILLNGKPHIIRKNLGTTLRRFRTNRFCCCNLVCSCSDSPYYPETMDKHFTSPTLLWIDALCINQKDEEELSKQVTIMKDIYQQAEEVIVWLGEDEGDAVPALRLLHGLAELWSEYEDEVKVLVSYVVKNELFRSYWHALGSFLGRPWWNRVWTIQEIVMAQKATLVCGRWCADWNEISKATTLYNHCLDYMDEIIEANIFDQPAEFLIFQRNAGSLKLLKLLKFFCERPFAPGPTTFHTLLDMSKNRFSTNPLDKIYAIVGILEQLSGVTLLKIDYTITTCELYMHVCRILYDETKSLSFLSMVERNRMLNQNQKFDLPSWSPDWTVQTNMDPLFRGGSHPPPWSSANPKPRSFSEKFFFTGSSSASCVFHFPSKRLTVTGFEVATITIIQQRFKDLIPDFPPTGVKYGKRICWHPQSPSEDFECDTFWLTRLKPVHTWKKATDCAEEKLPHLDVLVFFTETHRFLGMTDAAIKPGDCICALLGGNSPYILRAREDSFVFIGQCVLFGMMNGEIMEGLSKGVFTLREFTLI